MTTRDCLRLHKMPTTNIIHSKLNFRQFEFKEMHRINMLMKTTFHFNNLIKYVKLNKFSLQQIEMILV